MRQEYFLTNLHVTSGERNNKSFSLILEIALKMVMGTEEALHRCRSASGTRLVRKSDSMQMLNALKENLTSM